MVELFPYHEFAEQAVSGCLSASEVAARVRSLVSDALLAGAGRMARAFLDRLPASQYVRRVFAWYVSRNNSYFRVLPFRMGDAFDAAVDVWDCSDQLFWREQAHYNDVVWNGSRRRGSLLVLWAVLCPHGPEDLDRALSAAITGLATAAGGRGNVHYISLPLPPEEELGEFDA